MGQVTQRWRVRNLASEQEITRPETLIVEELLEIGVNEMPVTAIIGTLGFDIELTQGCLLIEELIPCREDVLSVSNLVGAMLVVREDIGSNNAVDKAIG